jgi:hypothetical protein
MAKPKSKTPIGEHWKNTTYSPLYQLYRRVEKVADDMRERQKVGWAPLVAHVTELDAIATELKILDKKPPQKTTQATK